MEPSWSNILHDHFSKGYWEEFHLWKLTLWKFFSYFHKFRKSWIASEMEQSEISYSQAWVANISLKWLVGCQTIWFFPLYLHLLTRRPQVVSWIYMHLWSLVKVFSSHISLEHQTSISNFSLEPPWNSHLIRPNCWVFSQS